MNEPTRKLPHPELDKDGCWNGQSTLSPESFKVRGALPIPPSQVIPVIFVPGTMGSNLKANSKNKTLKPNQPVWRPPNGAVEGGIEVWKWQGRKPKHRQNILDPDGAEVDDSGAVNIPLDWATNQSATARERGWGTVHWKSYGEFLFMLQQNLNSTFMRMGERRVVQEHWQTVMNAKREKWDASDMPPLTEDDLLKYAKYQYPVYAVGYNWLQSNEQAAKLLQKRIEEIMAWWNSRKHNCKYVIIVTHSMGGLVARACVKLIPDKVLGVIHGVMPAVGTPLAYRRIACGTETTSPSNNTQDNLEAGYFADIVGRTAAETMPVMGASPGVLELLPNHRYPERWLRLGEIRRDARKHAINSIVTAEVTAPSDALDEEQKMREIVSLPEGDPYAMYRDFKPWYRLLDPALCDPAKRYEGKLGGVIGIVTKAIDQAEHFHKNVIDEHYHPNTYAFYGEDGNEMSYGTVRWAIQNPDSHTLTPEQLKAARLQEQPEGDARFVKIAGMGEGVEQHRFFHIQPQDAKGDGTVAPKSGAAPKGKSGVKRVFKTQGYDHQGSYNDKQMALLTKHLIVKMVAEKGTAC